MEKRAIITVLGRDCKGIIAAVSGALAQSNANILDINQTVLQDMFTMAMLVDYSEMEPDFETMRTHLAELGEKMGVEIRMQRKAIFDAMHRV
jgi:ACT domain-containing protein